MKEKSASSHTQHSHITCQATHKKSQWLHAEFKEEGWPTSYPSGCP